MKRSVITILATLGAAACGGTERPSSRSFLPLAMPRSYDREVTPPAQTLRDRGDALNTCAADEKGAHRLICRFGIASSDVSSISLSMDFKRLDRACHDGVKKLTGRDATHIVELVSGERLPLLPGSVVNVETPVSAVVVEVDNPHRCDHVEYAFAVFTAS